MMITNQPHALYTRENAERIAAEMQANETDGWTYTAVHPEGGTGYSFIEIRDEVGEAVGRV